ncbi:MAG: NADPH-dependent FMN reductase [Verrucomicrobia bacterium]|nr:NADPH-dependent FMN reductase [Verrucomicrobiota bacterium]|tara:strand:- start:546 stop:1064 length:519 start_codon:yes stop_codon:yes gene_type:complete
MITIVSASNRKENSTAHFAQHCKRLLEQKGAEHRFFSLEQLPSELSLQSIYEQEVSVFKSITKEYISDSDKFLFVIPEYNGSFPGILKLFIDGIHPSEFYGKKAALIGIAAGRAGNLRGMDHFTAILNYIQVSVMPQKLPISSIDRILNGGEIDDEASLKLLDQHIDQLIAF